MFRFTTTILSLLPLLTPFLTSAQDTSAPYPIPIALGYYAYPHGHQFIAWTPTTTTTTEACASRTVIQVDNSGYPSNPICDYPFDLNSDFTNLTLKCTDPTVEEYPEVTAVVNSEGVQTQVCEELQLTVYPTECDNAGSAVWQKFACQ